MGRTLSNTMVNLGIQSSCDEAMFQVRNKKICILTPRLETKLRVDKCLCQYIGQVLQGGGDFVKK